jgi:hypothetical protein
MSVAFSVGRVLFIYENNCIKTKRINHPGQAARAILYLKIESPGHPSFKRRGNLKI